MSPNVPNETRGAGMDQQVGRILIPLAILISPLVAAYWGLQQRSRGKAFLIGWGSTILTGGILGVIVAVIVDAIASQMPGGNPWIGPPQGLLI